MIIKNKNNNLIFTNALMGITMSLEDPTELVIHTSSSIECLVRIPDSTTQAECMDHIYKCYKRDDRCCDLNDLIKDKTK